MATLALQVAGSALGQFLGGPVGASIGAAIGASAGALIDRSLLNQGTKPVEGPRLSSSNGISANEGNPIPRIYGRVRLGGQVIWATEFEEERTVEKSGSSGGKSVGVGGGGSSQKTLRYSYYANVAIGLCEGPVHLLRRIWADGKPLDLAGVTMRFYNGSADQDPDPLIIAKQETADMPACRGLAYVVFERFPLADYGNRLPQFSFELVRAADGLPGRLRAVNLIPGATEFGYETTEVREDFGYGNSRALNRAQWNHPTDWEAALDDLQALCPNLERVTLINSWFGDDLRASFCSLRPRVETSAKATTGATWLTAGLSRAAARPVSKTGDRPNYGGSPSDASIIHAIRDLKARGLKVALNPFILMDIPAGNTLPDPYTGGVGQPAFPWRGRITASPAPGRTGSPEGSSAVNAQIAAFFGVASASQFSLSGERVVYNGPNEWSLRRMVLHNAMLARAAGGVDTFFLSSELVGLTRLSAGNGVYPAVQGLIALASEVRSLLGPATLITYAADWSEYSADVRNSGADIRFPLDPLWANANIGAVAIDFYPPLSDWRDGALHLDRAVAYSAADPAYLEARIASGEAYDWYYASDAARKNQTRSPINDGAYGKPWVFRQKDIRNWWLNPHIERVNGVELATPTPWVPQSKPVLFAEIGGPAVDKGGNQPNVFPDAKSSENALPHFSTGARDDLVQRRLIEAYIARFDPASPGFDTADNPVSTLYGGRMVMPDFIAPWAYDTRPFPAFPTKTSLWSDGENWARGHWLNGRLEAVPIAALVAMILRDHGHPPASITALDGIADGYIIDRPMSARAALEPVAGLFNLTFRATGDTLVVNGPPVATSLTITREDIVAAKDGTEIDITRAQESELPRVVSLGFLDSERDFYKAVVSARKDDSLARREISDDIALVMPRGRARALIETRLQDLWLARETWRFTLRGNARRVEPGDLVTLETPAGPASVLITRISDTLQRACEGRAFTPLLNANVPVIDEPILDDGTPALPGAAHVRVMELPVARGSSAGPLQIAVRAEPWRGPYSLARINADGTLETLGAAVSAARLGQTLTALPPGPLWRWDKAASLDITLESGALSSLGADAVLAGGNALALFDAGGKVEIIQFQSASLIGQRRYRLTGLLRGLALSEGAAARSLPAGSDCVVMDDALEDLGLSSDVIGRAVELLVLPAGRKAGDGTQVRITALPQGLALRPPAPVGLKAKRGSGGVNISFIRRTRVNGDSFDLYEVPLGEEREDYRIDILAGETLKRSLFSAASSLLYASSDEMQDFGGPQTSLSLSIRQISALVGPGDALNASIPVR